ncbi:plasmid mobilization protein, partial [Desulfovibrio piger]|uniref:plasmid mobilization protein n=1 Tax=Desulfovibrio piger TaxID=901 RepID=UPI003F6556AE
MKGKKNKHKPKADALISFRLTSEQRGAFQRQVEVTGLSTSEYIRRKIFGGRPLRACLETSAFIVTRRHVD